MDGPFRDLPPLPLVTDCGWNIDEGTVVAYHDGHAQYEPLVGQSEALVCQYEPLLVQ